MERYYVRPNDAYDKVAKGIGIKKGIYTIHCAGRNNDTAPIDRLLGVDREGILYIGSSHNLLHRFGSLRKGLLAAANIEYIALGAHTVAKHYKDGKIQNRFPIANLFVEFEILSATENQLDIEQERINVYIANYGEAPPFNERLTT